jgi:hypothetical protein
VDHLFGRTRKTADNIFAMPPGTIMGLPFNVFLTVISPTLAGFIAIALPNQPSCLFVSFTIDGLV